MDEIYADKGNKIATDGINDKKRYLVTNENEIDQIEKTNKSGGTTQVKNVTSAEQLPSDVALIESLNVLDRTEGRTATDKTGGLHEESSFVMKDGVLNNGKVWRQPPGGPATITANNELEAKENLSLPLGRSDSEVEATIHSHLTGSIVKDGVVYSHDATKPTSVDPSTFGKYTTNIIVGPLEKAQGFKNSSGEVSTTRPTRGIAVYNGASATPSIILSRKAVERILKN